MKKREMIFEIDEDLWQLISKKALKRHMSIDDYIPAVLRSMFQGRKMSKRKPPM